MWRESEIKRIIGGKTYNTETATRVAKAWFHPQDERWDELYQTRHGAYFRSWGDPAYDEDGIEQIEPLTPSEAQTWMEKHASAELIEQHFGEQPEAGEAESRVTLRIPDSLKSRIEGLAISNKQSLNTWIIRCLEECSSADYQKCAQGHSKGT